MTEEYFEQSKQTQIVAITAAYYKKKRELYNETNAYMLRIQSSRYNRRLKSRIINSIVRTYYRKLNNYEKNMSAEIQVVKNSVYIPPVVETSVVEPTPTLDTVNKSTDYALLIGTNYVGSQYQLSGCVNDVDSLNIFAGSNNFDITILSDKSTLKATRTNILSEFTKVLSNSQIGDSIFLSYSGHGSYIKDTDNNELIGYDQVIVPSDFKQIIDDELKQIIQTHLKPGVTLVALFDCCYSGTVLDLKYNYMDSIFGNGTQDIANTQETETNGDVIMISGCSDIQTSADAYIDGKYQGAMTWSFLQSVRISKTWRELVTNMRQKLSTNGLTQIPQLSSGKQIDIDTSHKII